MLISIFVCGVWYVILAPNMMMLAKNETPFFVSPGNNIIVKRLQHLLRVCDNCEMGYIEILDN